MDHERLRDWVSHVDGLTAAPRMKVTAVLSGPPEGASSLAAIDLDVNDERRCPHCGTGGAVPRDKARGLHRFRVVVFLFRPSPDGGLLVVVVEHRTALKCGDAVPQGHGLPL